MMGYHISSDWKITHITRDRCYRKFVHLITLFIIEKGGGARGSVVGWSTTLQAGRSRVRVSMRSIFVFNLPNPPSGTMALGSIQPLTEMSARNLTGG
jgi:hypothetical protein